MNLTPQCIYISKKKRKKKLNTNTIDTILNKAKKKKKKVIKRITVSVHHPPTPHSSLKY
jgi:hypothetical protein